MDVQIIINGEAYPCKLTLGAMLRFRELTGHEYTAFDGSTLDLCAMIYACAKSACKRERKAFDFSFDDFCDMLTPEEINETWGGIQREAASQAPEGESAAEGEKKSPSAS